MNMLLSLIKFGGSPTLRQSQWTWGIFTNHMFGPWWDHEQQSQSRSWTINPPSKDPGWWLSPTPLKNMSSSVGMIILNIWENKKCSKPPARIYWCLFPLHFSKWSWFVNILFPLPWVKLPYILCNIFLGLLISPNYPLANVYITMERSTMIHGKIHYKYGHFQ